MRFPRRTKVCAAGVLVLLSSTWAPVTAQPVARSAALPVLNWYGLSGTSTWAQTLDSAMVTDTISGGILNMTDAGLVKYLPNGSVGPSLASAWRVSKDRKVYTFTIRSNARFANGDPVTAQAAAWSLTRSLSKATNSPTSLQNLSHIVGATRWNTGKAKSLQGVKAAESTSSSNTARQTDCLLSWRPGDVQRVRTGSTGCRQSLFPDVSNDDLRRPSRRRAFYVQVPQ